MKASSIMTGPTTVALPTGYYREIGRIMVYWAHIEFLLRRATHIAAGLDQKLGRVALMEPRPEGVPEHIRKVFLARHMVPPTFRKELKDEISKLYDWRNALAHGVWIDLPNIRYPVLQYTKGARKSLPDAPGKGVPHKVDPISYRLTVTQLKQMADAYFRYIEIANEIISEVRTSEKASLKK